MKKIYIEGMSCNHCTAHVTAALANLPGVLSVIEVSLSGKYALIEGTASDQIIREVIDQAGYDVSRIE